MPVSGRLLLTVLLGWAAMAWGQPARREPHIGYVYPAGGRRGTVTEVLVGGQNLRGAKEIYISGEGVTATVIQHYPPLRNLNGDQRRELQRRLRELIARRVAELPDDGQRLSAVGSKLLKNRRNGGAPATPEEGESPEPTVELPEHHLLRDLDRMSLRQLLHVRNELLDFKKRQLNMQIAESVLIEVKIDAKASPGDREIRIQGPAGLTNPMLFQVGLLPEIAEQEPNDPDPLALLEAEPACDLPVLFNGQIKPGDVDRFHFRARRGQKLVIETQARHLIPYLADAVPGWFQATLTLYDQQGNEAVFIDDYRFHPDPVLLYEVPSDGEYALEIRDAIYRGRDDFIYRIAVAEHPFITHAFPLGGRIGSWTMASIEGWNLPGDRLQLNTGIGDSRVRETAVRRRMSLSNAVTYAVDTLPDVDEAEPNDTAGNAQHVDLPHVVNGRIGQAGDVDMFRFEAKSGGEVVIETFARRVGSPLDSLLRLTDASGSVIAWNDDHEDREAGLCTHHADSYVRAALPEDGAYLVQLGDSQRHGGPAYAYRLRISEARPDFALRVTPSSINMRVSRAALICVHALRKDGFDGEIEVVLEETPAGFSLSGGRIPRGRDSVCMTLTAPARRIAQPVPIKLTGVATIDGVVVKRSAAPAEDLMQAFLYRHLVPTQELLVAVLGGRPGRPFALAGKGPVKLSAEGKSAVRITGPREPIIREFALELREPPDGVTLEDVRFRPDGLDLVLAANVSASQIGYADNLIVEAFTRINESRQDGKAAKASRRISVGYLPAIPFEIVRPPTRSGTAR